MKETLIDAFYFFFKPNPFQEVTRQVRVTCVTPHGHQRPCTTHQIHPLPEHDHQNIPVCCQELRWFFKQLTEMNVAVATEA